MGYQFLCGFARVVTVNEENLKIREKNPLCFENQAPYRKAMNQDWQNGYQAGISELKSILNELEQSIADEMMPRIMADIWKKVRALEASASSTSPEISAPTTTDI